MPWARAVVGWGPDGGREETGVLSSPPLALERANDPSRGLWCYRFQGQGWLQAGGSLASTGYITVSLPFEFILKDFDGSCIFQVSLSY